MDVQYELNGISFAWDEAKARKNLEKHHVAFEQAAEVFFDPFLRLIDAAVEDETRDAVLGMDEQWQLLYVVHLLHEEDVIRIISARKASRSESKLYED